MFNKQDYPSVHRGIVLAAHWWLREHRPQTAAWYRQSDIAILADEVIKPDQRGDRQNGSGYHYYCAVDPKGNRRNFIKSDYYPNGKGNHGPSARTMFEEEYTIATALLSQGNRKVAMAHLARAAHMLADVCCPPHSCGLTYLSRYAFYHKRFEALAAKIFWNGADVWGEQAVVRRIANTVSDEVDITRYEKIAHQGAGALFNGTAQRSAAVLPSVLGRDKAALTKAVHTQLSLAIGETAALLTAFTTVP
ncbi:MAG: hypothetical protein ACI4J3_09175 [Oscillospiraceae bacterium]